MIAMTTGELLPYLLIAITVGVLFGSGMRLIVRSFYIASTQGTRPSPEVVAYAAVFVATFIGLSMVVRSSLKRLEGQI